MIPENSMTVLKILAAHKKRRPKSFGLSSNKLVRLFEGRKMCSTTEPLPGTRRAIQGALVSLRAHALIYVVSRNAKMSRYWPTKEGVALVRDAK